MKKNPVYFLIAETVISKTIFLAVKFGTYIKSTKNQGFFIRFQLCHRQETTKNRLY